MSRCCFIGKLPIVIITAVSFSQENSIFRATVVFDDIKKFDCWLTQL